ncbi:hypothetical protein Belba_3628 [Belliella baltica DSM 15883]|uniref:Beta-lactamase-inhibitor-like PepSY-like domain-containing protein n=1 Tax=Belliella baltica (strain DSM 15883 / CIP 108006 / LMG 21964 / BA134) TaxID=866536 RepID=I3ZA52_BELBD|nr:hypothetical protein [Belliella baltica]AFL86120.1 hypothetical protein Belba_3628 [Belliella baltica DSM 15883]
MKTKIIIPALLFLGMTSVPVFSSPTATETRAIEVTVQEQEKVKIDPENLPELVKETIALDSETASLMISEAWKSTNEEGKTYFKIKFDKAGEELVKKYGVDGKEIKETTNQ